MYEIFQEALRPLESLTNAALAPWLDVLLKSTIVLLLAFTFALAARRRSAAQRHFLWTLAIVATLAMPAMSGLIPGVEVPLPRGVPMAIAPTATSTVPTADRIAAGVTTEAVSPVGTGVRARRAAPPARVNLSRAVGASGETRTTGSSGAGIPPGTVVFGLWLAGALGVLGRLLVGALRLARLEARTERIAGGPLLDETRRVARRLGLRRVPVVLRGGPSEVPMTWGLFRARLLLPDGVEDWEPWSREAVLLHELGHVRRHDYVAQVAADVACALYWFHPLVWIAATRMRIEREHACDDLVVEAGHEAGRYADALVRLARRFRHTPAEAAALAFARPNRLRDRLVALLDQGRSRRPLGGPGTFALGLTAFAIAALVASLTPAGMAAAPGEGVDLRAEVEPVWIDLATPRPADDESEVARAQAVPATALALPVLERALDRAPSVGLPRAVRQATVLCGPADGEAHRRSSQTNDDVRTIEAEYGDCRSTVRIEGDIEFTRDFTAIASLSSRALIRFDVERGGSRQRLEVRPGPAGRPDYDWTVDGRDQAFDASAQAWLESALVNLFRSTSYMAKERVLWILSQEGPDAVLGEVGLLLSDHTQSTYLAVLLDEGDLSPAYVRSAITLAGREIESDHSLGQVLIAAADRYPFDSATRTAFLEAAVSIESDHTQGRIFETALTREDLSQSDLEFLLRSAASSIESDHTLGEVLRSLASRYVLEPALRDPFLEAARTLASDHTAGEVYGVLLEQRGLRADELAAILDASTEIESDHTLGELLQSAAGAHDLSDATLMEALLGAAATIQSDHTLSTTLIEVARMDGMGERSQIALLETARGIDSDHSLAEFLIQFADRYSPRGAVLEAFERTLEGVGSRHSRENVRSALEGRGP